MNQSFMELGYWKIKGRAEVIRLLIKFLGISNVNFQYFDNPQIWSERKKNQLTCFPNLPYLADGTTIITETPAIIDHLIIKSQREELYGKTIRDQVLVTQIRSIVRDLFNSVPIQKLQDPKFKEILLESCKAKANVFQQVDKQYYNKEWLVGYITIADIELYYILDMVNSLDSKFLNQFENLKNLYLLIEEIPNIRNYLERDRKNPRPFFNEIF